MNLGWSKKKGNSNIGVTQPRCKAYVTQNTSVASGVGYVPIAMNRIEYDTDDIHTSDPTKFRINTAGLYLIVHQNYVSKYDVTVNVGILKNGVDIIANLQPAIDANTSALVYLKAGDYVQPAIQQTSGAAITLVFAETYLPYISIVKISD